MTDVEWAAIADEIMGLWGTSQKDVMTRRLALWHKRWGTYPRSVVRAAIQQLELTCDHWPGVARMHAAVQAAAPGKQGARGGPPAREPDRPLTSVEWHQGAEMLRQAAKRSRYNRAYLDDLATFYAGNADRVRRHEAPVWPPPPASGSFAALRLALGDGPTRHGVIAGDGPFERDGRE